MHYLPEYLKLDTMYTSKTLSTPNRKRTYEETRGFLTSPEFIKNILSPSFIGETTPLKPSSDKSTVQSNGCEIASTSEQVTFLVKEKYGAERRYRLDLFQKHILKSVESLATTQQDLEIKKTEVFEDRLQIALDLSNATTLIENANEKIKVLQMEVSAIEADQVKKLEDDSNSKQALADLEEERLAVRYFIWSREDKPFTYLPLETIREMLGLKNVTDVNALHYRECKLYLRCLKNFGLEGNSDFRLEKILTGCEQHGIGVLRKRIMDYLGFEEGEDRSFAVYNIETTTSDTAVTQSASSTSSINIEPSNDELMKQLVAQQQQINILMSSLEEEKAAKRKRV